MSRRFPPVDSMSPKNRRKIILLCSVLLILSALVYLPGVSGPYLFDDHSNLLVNTYIRLESLNLESIYQASYSLTAGPLQRPVAMASFALNYYFAGGFSSPLSFKATNIAIHAINGLLVFWLVSLILTRRARILAGARRRHRDNDARKTSLFLAAAIALLWVVHPIQLTSVLYIVQRMTSLSALFSLLGIILYIKGRQQILAGEIKYGWWLILVGILGCGTLGMLSKENAVLMPVFMLLLEFLLFPAEKPWSSYKNLPARAKKMVLAGILVGVILLTVLAINYALPGYAYRDFTLTQRLMTEGRVLFFYLSLILVPRLNQFGLFHDDIPISVSLLDPVTTIFSLAGLAAMILVAILSRKKYVLLSLGILWFLTGHLLESTILPLEIAHEHRNYLASLGVLFVIAEIIAIVSLKSGGRKWWLALPVLAVIFSGVTLARAIQWSNADSHHLFEASHHPKSAAAQMGLATLLYTHGKYADGLQALHRAAELEPLEAAALINIQTIAAITSNKIGALNHQEIIKRLANGPTSATTIRALQASMDCIQDKCESLQPHMEEWLKTLLDHSQPRSDKSFYYYLLGRTLFSQGKLNPAVDAYRRSYELDANFLHPLFDLAELYIQSNRADYAKVILSEIRRASQRVPWSRESELKEFEDRVARMESSIRKNRSP